ncbi:unnamed protein product [Caenorhabditis brenneri]
MKSSLYGVAFLIMNNGFKPVFGCETTEKQAPKTTVEVDPEMDKKPIVFDLGSTSVKAGFSGDKAPRTILPSMKESPSHNTGLHLDEADCKDSLVGNKAQSRRESLSMNHPIKNRIVTNWDDMISLMDHTFKNELHVKSEEHTVLLAESLSNPKANKEKMTEVMFERFNVPSYYVDKATALSLFHSGKTTGFVIDSGEGVTDIVSIYDYFVVPHTYLRLDLGGTHLTDFLSTLLAGRGFSLKTKSVQDLKEQSCCVAPIWRERMNSESDIGTTSTLEDSQANIIENLKFLCPEAFFEMRKFFEKGPFLVNMESLGLHRMCHKSILTCDHDHRKYLYSNIVLSGGSTLFPGLRERLEQEMRQLAPSSMTIRVADAKDHKHSVWCGGSFIASLPKFQEICISKEEYEESGSSVVHR